MAKPVESLVWRRPTGAGRTRSTDSTARHRHKREHTTAARQLGPPAVCLKLVGPWRRRLPVLVEASPLPWLRHDLKRGTAQTEGVDAAGRTVGAAAEVAVVEGMGGRGAGAAAAPTVVEKARAEEAA
eukprot:4096912-Prymnesium_polylepis.2